MSREEKFEFDIANLKKDLAIENMNIYDEDIKPAKELEIEYYDQKLAELRGKR